MKKRALLAVILAATLTATAWAGDKVDPKAAFERLKTLAGDWTGQGPQGMVTPVSYKVSANGSVVMETLFAGTPHEMITMYYLAGNDLVMAFDGGSNIDPAKDNFMHGGRISFVPDGKVETQWEVYAGGKQAGAHTFRLARVGK